MDHNELDDIDVDFDITAIYVLGDKKVDFPESKEITERVIEKAMKEARRKHKEAGVPMVVWENGKIRYIPAGGD